MQQVKNHYFFNLSNNENKLTVLDIYILDRNFSKSISLCLFVFSIRFNVIYFPGSLPICTELYP